MADLPVADRLLLGLAPVLARGVIGGLHLTHRVSMLNEQIPLRFWKSDRNIIIVFWHDQLLMMPKAYHGPGASILISASRDGELIARTIRRFNFDTIRGSSTRGGSAAFREMVAKAREPFDLAITPDGPKGPRHLVKDGVAALARLTGRPVVPLSFAASCGYRFASWDRFLLPYPWARTVFRYGEPIFWSAGESSEIFRSRVQAGLDENLNQAQLFLESHGVSAV
jgi:lysophospholipid acyltransferase (LPLAT)-like uncharacterized protein